MVHYCLNKSDICNSPLFESGNVNQQKKRKMFLWHKRHNSDDAHVLENSLLAGGLNSEWTYFA